jgi:hypothetical protein
VGVWNLRPRNFDVEIESCVGKEVNSETCEGVSAKHFV